MESTYPLALFVNLLLVFFISCKGDSLDFSELIFCVAYLLIFIENFAMSRLPATV